MEQAVNINEKKKRRHPYRATNISVA